MALLLTMTSVNLPSCGASPVTRPTMAIFLAPPTKLATSLGGPPFRWNALWTVNVEIAGVPESSLPGVVTVSTGLESARGRQLTSPAEGSAVPVRTEAGLFAQLAQSVEYMTDEPPPTTSLVKVQVRYVDGRGRAIEEIRLDSIIESLCGARGQPPCPGGSALGATSATTGPSQTARR